MSGRRLEPEVFISFGGRPRCAGRGPPDDIEREMWSSRPCGGRLGIGCKLCAAYRKKGEEEGEAWLKAHLSKLAAMSDEEKKKRQEEIEAAKRRARLRWEQKKAEMKERREATRRRAASRRRKIEHLGACADLRRRAASVGKRWPRLRKWEGAWLDSLPEPELNGQ